MTEFTFDMSTWRGTIAAEFGGTLREVGLLVADTMDEPLGYTHLDQVFVAYRARHPRIRYPVSTVLDALLALKRHRMIIEGNGKIVPTLPRSVLVGEEALRAA